MTKEELTSRVAVLRDLLNIHQNSLDRTKEKLKETEDELKELEKTPWARLEDGAYIVRTPNNSHIVIGKRTLGSHAYACDSLGQGVCSSSVICSINAGIYSNLVSIKELLKAKDTLDKIKSLPKGFALVHQDSIEDSWYLHNRTEHLSTGIFSSIEEVMERFNGHYR